MGRRARKATKNASNSGQDGARWPRWLPTMAEVQGMPTSTRKLTGPNNELVFEELPRQTGIKVDDFLFLRRIEFFRGMESKVDDFLFAMNIEFFAESFCIKLRSFDT